MPLNPQDIVRKEFREALRGYNQADVDLFLDEVVEEFGRLSDENQKMKVRIAALQQEVARLREGRGGAAPAASREAPEQVEAEVRARVRRFLEEQIRLIEAGGTSATVEKIAREAPKATQPITAEPEESREPFWAGE
jgi:cell division initiation protein